MNHGGRRILALLIFVLGKHPQFCDNLLKKIEIEKKRSRGEGKEAIGLTY
jgi:hypothetical protein